MLLARVAMHRVRAAIVAAPADVLGAAAGLELGEARADRRPGQRGARRRSVALDDLRQTGEPAVRADQRRAGRRRGQRAADRAGVGGVQSRQQRAPPAWPDVDALGHQVGPLPRRQPGVPADRQRGGARRQRRVGRRPDRDEARHARLGLEDGEVVAGVAGHDPAVQHRDPAAHLERLRAPDAVRRGEDQPALGVDDDAGALLDLAADARRDRHHAEVEPLGWGAARAGPGRSRRSRPSRRASSRWPSSGFGAGARSMHPFQEDLLLVSGALADANPNARGAGDRRADPLPPPTLGPRSG